MGPLPTLRAMVRGPQCCPRLSGLQGQCRFQCVFHARRSRPVSRFRHGPGLGHRSRRIHLSKMLLVSGPSGPPFR